MTGPRYGSLSTAEGCSTCLGRGGGGVGGFRVALGLFGKEGQRGVVYLVPLFDTEVDLVTERSTGDVASTALDDINLSHTHLTYNT